MSHADARAGDPNPARTRRRRSAVGLLADDASRAVLLALGEAAAGGGSGLAITEQQLPGITPRVIRERLRDLERSGIAQIVERGPANGGPPSRWGLTTPGLDLYRLQALIARIVARASDPRKLTRRTAEDRAVGQVLSWFADPVSVQILSVLAVAGAPLGPVGLEEAAPSVPRRTLYRRLGPLLDEGAVVRSTGRTVPRSTWYELDDHWRPVAAIPVLCAWWESRHWDDPSAAAELDLEGVLHSIAPLVRLEAATPGRRVKLEFEGSSMTLAVQPDGRVDVEAQPTSDDASAPHAAVTGDNAAWATALVTDGAGGVQQTGDRALAREMILAIRAALLMYVR